ncbi:tomoregulin-2-like [Manacus vitellinus]|uniref:tomoregulin-2-like n=1 Tax=Manacus vitellinus TaxID=328815 RepID=UPI00084706AF|nr:tomoregulin-2-like [Manacus vitellinus]
MGLESDIAVLFNTLLHAVGVGSQLAKSEIHACIRELNLQSDLLVFPGENEGYDDRENDLFLCDTNTCKFDGECLRIGDSVTCVCQFKCNNDYVPVCGSNGDTYQNECYLKQAACKQQSEILLVSEGSCATDAGSGSGDGGAVINGFACLTAILLGSISVGCG